MFKKTIIGFSAVLFLVFLLVPSRSEAITVTPAIRELNLIAGEETTAVVELENDGLEKVELTTEVVNYTAKGESGEPDFDFDSAPTGAALWMEVTEGPIIIQPGQKTQVAVTFDTPANAQPGGYYAAVLFNMGDSSATTERRDVTIESKIAVPFLATVKGSYTEGGKIIAFGLEGNKTSYTAGPVVFSPLRYQNTGDIHLKPTGRVDITDMFGKTVKSIIINEDLGAVLPNSIRKFEVGSWNNLGSAFGKYTATLTLTAGSVKNTASVDFWVLSTTGIVIAVVVFIILIFLIVLLVNKASKKSSPANK